MTDSWNSLNILSEEWNILGDLIKNLYQNGPIFGEENNNITEDANKI